MAEQKPLNRREQAYVLKNRISVNFGNPDPLAPLNAERVRSLLSVNVCAGIDPKRTPSTVIDGNPGNEKPFTQNCVKEIEESARKGWLPDMHEYLLALRQIPSPATNDIKAQLASFVADRTRQLKSGGDYINLCMGSNTECNDTKLTEQDALIALGGSLSAPSTTMNQDFGVQFGRSGAAVNAFADALMNASKYIPEGQTAQIVTNNVRKKYSKQDVETVFAACISGRDDYEISQCTLAGIRKGIGMIADDGIHYEGSKFMGTPVTPSPSSLMPRNILFSSLFK